MTSDQWHYRSHGKKYGPVPRLKLDELAALGVLRPIDEVWQEGTPDWVEAGDIPGLFPKCGRSVADLPPYSPSSRAGPSGESQSRENDIQADEVAELRAIMNHYATQANGNDIQDFGYRVTILESKATSVLRVTTTSLYETREVHYKEQTLRQPVWRREYTTAKELKVPANANQSEQLRWSRNREWYYILPSDEVADIRTFLGKHEENEYLWPVRAKKRLCADCDGEGVVECDCAKGRLRCRPCGGGGRTKNKCTTCSGSGKVWNSRFVNTMTRTCPLCGGRRTIYFFGETICWECGGQGHIYVQYYEDYTTDCPSCRGEGWLENTCMRCEGSGTVVCPLCHEGFRTCAFCQGRKFTHTLYYVIEQKLEAGMMARCVAMREVSDVVMAILQDSSDYQLVLDYTRREYGAVRERNFVLPVLPGAVQEAVDELRQEEADECRKRRKRISRQRLRIEQTAVREYKYVYAGKEYAFTLVGNQKTAFAPCSPVTEYCSLKQELNRQRRKIWTSRPAFWLQHAHHRVPLGVFLYLCCHWSFVCSLFVLKWLAGNGQEAWPAGVPVLPLVALGVCLAGGLALWYTLSDKEKFQERMDELNAPIHAEMDELQNELDRLRAG